MGEVSTVGVRIPCAQAKSCGAARVRYAAEAPRRHASAARSRDVRVPRRDVVAWRREPEIAKHLERLQEHRERRSLAVTWASLLSSSVTDGCSMNRVTSWS